MNIVIVAVGGQGALFAARVIGAAALRHRLDVKVSEVHGMSQRGGSVVTHVRYGSSIASPIVEEGGADAVVAMELLEGARAATFLRPGGTLIVNEQKIPPMPVLAGSARYPDDLIDRLRKAPLTVCAVDALALAREAGNARAVNAVLLGCLAHTAEFSRETWTDVIRSVSPASYVNSNISAFGKGYSSVRKAAQ